MPRWLIRFLQWLAPEEQTWCGGCKRFSHGNACPYCDALIEQAHREYQQEQARYEL